MTHDGLTMISSEHGETHNDAQLLASARRGQQAAFAQLFDRHVRAVFWQAYKHLNDADAAQDVVQDAFHLLWQKRETVHISGESILPWLMVTAHNLARNALRKTHRHAALSLVEEITADETTEPATVAEAALIAEHIEAAVNALSTLDRQLFELCIDHELSYEQAAEKLGVSHGTVRNRLSRLRQRLRGDLANMREEA